MTYSGRAVPAGVIAALLLLADTPVRAQETRSAMAAGTWSIGTSAEFDLRNDTLGKVDVGAGFDANVERRVSHVGKRDVLGIRIQVGRAPAGWSSDGLSSARLLAGVVRHRCFIPDVCYGSDGYVAYFLAGGGVRWVARAGGVSATAEGRSFPTGGGTKPAAFAGIGLNRKLGTQRASFRLEFRAHVTGTKPHTEVSVGFQAHVP
jgi:hypothetical protein